MAPRPTTTASRPVTAPVRTLTADERTLLSSLADQLIPGDATMPSASGVDVTGALLDRVLSVRSDLVEPLRQSLSAHAGGDVPAEQLAGDQRFSTIRYVVAAAYYLDARVRAALDYDPEHVAPVRALDFPEYLEEGLLDHLVDAT